jgi:Kef-type K+ transport system membrane component KefB
MEGHGIVPLLAALALVIAAAKAGGWLSSRLGQPAVLGELLVGIILGPSVFDLFGYSYFEDSHVTENLHQLGELGVILLMFAAGLEIHLSDLTKTGKAAVLVGILGVAFPILLGAGTLYFLFGTGGKEALFIGVVLGATSVSISAQTLLELGLLRSREGLTLLGAAVVDDVLAIAVLSAFVAIAGEGDSSVTGVLLIFGRMFLFLVGAFFLSMWLFPRLVEWGRTLRISQPVMSLTVISILAVAWASEAIGGVAVITGAFLVGVALSKSSQKDEIERDTRILAYAFFVPVFLVSIGLNANARDLTSSQIMATIAIIIVAIVSKLVGGGLGARLGGMSWRESLRVGTGMISRGEVGLIIAGVGITQDIIQTPDFTLIVVMILVTTLVTPPLLRWTFSEKEVKNA